MLHAQREMMGSTSCPYIPPIRMPISISTAPVLIMVIQPPRMTRGPGHPDAGISSCSGGIRRMKSIWRTAQWNGGVEVRGRTGDAGLRASSLALTHPEIEAGFVLCPWLAPAFPKEKSPKRSGSTSGSAVVLLECAYVCQSRTRSWTGASSTTA